MIIWRETFSLRPFTIAAELKPAGRAEPKVARRTIVKSTADQIFMVQTEKQTNGLCYSGNKYTRHWTSQWG